MDYNQSMKNVERLIFLHGWGMNACVFEPIIKCLEPGLAVTNVNLPGYGDSNWDASLCFEDQLEQMAGDLPSGRLLGWSMGGIYAIELATRYPQKFSELILLSCNPCFVRRQDWDCAVQKSVFDAFADDLKQGWQSTIRRFLSLQMHGGTQARDLIRQLSKQMVSAGEPDAKVLQFGLNLLKQRDCRPLLASLQQPVKMIFGARDKLVPITIRHQISNLNPQIQVESLADAAHAPFLSNTAEVVALL
jgi:pimeloyl-[acyl-carrier protein] methyl ester esterase